MPSQPEQQQLWQIFHLTLIAGHNATWYRNPLWSARISCDSSQLPADSPQLFPQLLVEQARSRKGLDVEQCLAIPKTFLCYQHCLHNKSKPAAVMRRIRTLFQLKPIQWLWWGNAGLAASCTPNYKQTFPHIRKCWAGSQGNELTFWISIPFASDICNQSCWWYAWMAADRNDRVIAGMLSVEAPPSNAAQWMPASGCPSKTLCFLCLPLFQSFTFWAVFSITAPPFFSLRGYFGSMADCCQL